MDEREAVQRCLAGEKDAFGLLIRLYQPQILALCLRMTGSREDGADAAQQAFVQAFKHLDQYDHNQPFRPWLYRIATNESMSLLRRRRKQPTATHDEVLQDVESTEEGAPTLVDMTEDRERVREAVAGLPPHYRTVVVLHYFQELSYQEMARQTGLPVGTISTHLHRAKQLLKRALTETEVGAHEPHRSGAAAALSGR